MGSMPSLDETIELVKEYSDKYRHPRLEPFLISEKYALFPTEEESSSKKHWPNTYPYATKQGVYLMCSDNLDLLYVGKVSMNNTFGSRFSSYFSYESDGKTCKLKHEDNWSQKPHYLVNIAVEEDKSFEAPALEEFLIKKIGKELPDNKIGINR